MKPIARVNVRTESKQLKQIKNAAHNSNNKMMKQITTMRKEEHTNSNLNNN